MEIDYTNMRYILDSFGYIEEVTFGGLIQCNDKSCTEYNGEIPDGYESLEDWQIKANIRAYKIVDNNLVYDENRDLELKSQFEIEAEENSPATRKWVRNQAGKESTIVIDEFSSNASDSKLVVINDSGAYDIPEIVLNSENEVTGEVKVLVSNKNLLGIEAVTSKINGLDIKINSDGSITLNGTSTSAIEFILNGSLTSEEMLFLIKENTDYYKSGLTDNVSLNLYSYDGTDRTLISSGGDGLINLTDSSIITCSSLAIESGITFDNVTIYPQIEVESEVTEFIKHEENSITGALSDNKLVIDNELISYDSTSIVMNDRDLDINVTYFTGKSLETTKTSIEALEESIELSVTNINETLSTVQDAIETVQSTMLTQTAEQFEMLFTETGIEQTISEVQGLLDSQTQDMNTLSQYIKFKGASIELGRSDSLAKLIIANDKISFMNGENESAYITGNQLYITDSTILRKLQVGNWIEQEDENGNLNMRWVGGK